MNGYNVTYFDSFGVEHIQKEIHSKLNIKTSIYRIKANYSIMCGYFCIEFIDFMLEGKRLLEYTSLFSPNENKKDDKMILKYLQ